MCVCVRVRACVRACVKLLDKMNAEAAVVPEDDDWELPQERDVILQVLCNKQAQEEEAENGSAAGGAASLDVPTPRGNRKNGF